MNAVHFVSNFRGLMIDTIISVVLWFLIIVAFCWVVSLLYKFVQWMGGRWGTIGVYTAAFLLSFVLAFMLPAQHIPKVLKAAVIGAAR
jgi:hypothetical protein